MVQRDELPPGWSSGTLDATLQTPTRIGLGWPAASGGSGTPLTYHVYRGGTEIATTPYLDYVDTGLTPGTSYSYQVRASDPMANITPVMSALTLTTSTAAASANPSWPSGHSFTAPRVGKYNVELSWDSGTDDYDELRYTVSYRVSGTSTWTTGSTVDGKPGSATFVVVSGLAAATAYEFRVELRDFEGHAASTAPTLTATTLAASTAPSWPTGAELSSWLVDATSLALWWTPASVDTNRYRVYQVNGGVPTQIAEVTDSTYTVTGLTLGTTYTFEVRALDADDLSSTALSHMRAMLPPEPALVAPPRDSTQGMTFESTIAYLYTTSGGVVPPQPGVTTGTIVPERAAVLRGRVFTRGTGGDREPAAGVHVNVVGHPEYGEAWSSGDGWYEMAVNGGESVVIEARKDGHLPVLRRAAEVPWGEYSLLDDILLTAEATPTTISVNATTGVPPGGLGAVGPTVTGPAGEVGSAARQGALFFPAGTRVRACRAGTTATVCGNPLDLSGTLHVSITEFTVDNDVAVMSGDLPPASAYTYAVEYRVQEAEQAGAVRTEFTQAGTGSVQPVVAYVDNFLDLRRTASGGGAGAAAGYPIPMGWYDRVAGRWLPNEPIAGWNEGGSGRAVQILGLDSMGRANVDTDGDGSADNASLGLSDDERAWLGARYAGATFPKSLWRVPIQHFTTYDANMNIRPAQEDPASPDNQPGATPQPAVCPRYPGSTIECERRALGEAIEVPGIPHGMHYRNSRQAGWRDTLTIPMTLGPLRKRNGDPAEPPDKLMLRVEMPSIGRAFYRELNGTSSTPVPVGLVWTFGRCATEPSPEAQDCWDGRDDQGRVVQGNVPVLVRVGYAYAAEYGTTEAFGYRGEESGGITVIPMEGAPCRHALAFWSQRRVVFHNPDDRARGLGGWSFDVQHAWDPATRTVLLGNGQEFSVPSTQQGGLATRVVGQGWQDGFVSPDPTVPPYDGMGATSAPIRPTAIAVDRGGTLYVGFPQGMISTLGTDGNLHEGYSAGGARDYSDMAFGPDGSLYVAGGTDHRVWRWKDGAMSSFAGDGVAAPSGFIAAGAAASTRLDNPRGVAVAPDGTVYIAERDGNRIRRVGTDGVMTTFAGDGVAVDCTAGAAAQDGAAAASVTLGCPQGVAVGADGAIWIAHSHSIHRVTPDGVFRFVAGDPHNEGSVGPMPAPGVEGHVWRVNYPTGIAFTPYGEALFALRNNYNNMLGHFASRMGIDGRMHYFVGDGRESPFSVVELPALGPCVREPIRIAPGRRGEYYVLSNGTHVVLKVYPGSPDMVTLAEPRVPSPDGTEVYVFSGGGRHLRTEDAFTGREIYRFFHDDLGRLTRVRRRLTATANADTDIAWTWTGATVTTPDGDAVTLTLDGNGYLSQVASTDWGTRELRHDARGLLTALQDESGRWHRYGYDAQGRLERDAWGASETADLPGGRVVELSETEWTWSTDRVSRTVTLSDGPATGPRISRTHELRGHYDGREERVQTRFDGAPSSSAVRSIGTGFAHDSSNVPSQEVRHASSSAGGAEWSRTTEQVDPRFGRRIQVPVCRDERHGTLRYSTEVYRSVTGAGGSVWVPEPRYATQIIEDVRRVWPGGSDTDACSASVMPADGVNQRWRTRWFRTATTDPWSVETKTPMDRAQTVALDLDGRPTTITPPAISQGGTTLSVHAIDVTYDSLGRVETVTQGARTVTYAYHPSGGAGVQGRLASVTVSGGGVSVATSYGYTPSSRRVTASLPGHTTMTPRQLVTDFDVAGNLASLTPPGRPAHTFVYGWRDLLEEYTAPSASPHTSSTDRRTAYAHDATGRATQTDRAGEATATPATTGLTYGYTSGRLTSLTLPPVSGTRPVVSFGQHSTLGVPETTTDTRASVAGVTTLYDASTRGALPTGEQWTGTGASTAPQVTWDWDTVAPRPAWVSVAGGAAIPTSNPVVTPIYDGDGAVRRVQVTVSGATPALRADYVLGYDATAGTLQSTAVGDVSSPGRVETEHRYDAYGQVASVDSAVGGTASLSFAYAYDGIGRVQRITETDGSATEHRWYEYDAAGRLQRVCTGSATACGTERERYDYDANGNRTRTRYWTSTGTAISDETASYDDQDRLTGWGSSVTYDYDAQGRLATRTAGTEVTTYTHDAFGRLTGVARTGGSSPVTVTYHLDARGRRIGRTVGSATTRWLYRGGRVVAELDGDWKLTTVFVYGAHGHVPDVAVRREGSSGDEWVAYRVLTDHLGGVRRVVRATDGVTVQQMAYDAYGRVTQDTATTGWGRLPFGFAGGLYDRDTGLVRFGAREYDAEVGRWIEKDPIRFAGGDSNLYGYIQGDPQGGVDPEGLNPLLLLCATPAGAVICTAAVAAAATGVTATDVVLFVGSAAAVGVGLGWLWDQHRRPPASPAEPQPCPLPASHHAVNHGENRPANDNARPGPGGNVIELPVSRPVPTQATNIARVCQEMCNELSNELAQAEEESEFDFDQCYGDCLRIYGYRRP